MNGKGKHTPGIHSTQQPRGQFNNRVQVPVQQVSRSDDYLRQGSGYNPQAVSNPGLYNPPAGGVAGGQGPQQAPPQQQAVAMPGTATAHPNAQGASPQQTGVVPGQMQQQRTQNTMFFRQNVGPVRPPPFTMGWPTHNALNISNSAQQPSTSGFQTAVSSVAYLPNTAAYAIPQAALMGRTTQGVPVNVSTYQFPTACSPAPAQYNLHQSQHLYQLPPGNANMSPYGNQRPVYYGHQIQQITSVMNPQMTNRNNVQTLPPQQPSQQPMPLPAPKRERKPLRIQDPVTLEDINIKGEHDFSDQTAPDHSLVKENSHMEPVPTDQTDTRIQFAQQVAAVAIPGPPRKEPPKPECLVTPSLQPMLPPILPVMIGVPQGMLVTSPVPPDLLLEAADRTPIELSLDRQSEVINQEIEIVDEVPAYELGAPILNTPHEVIVGPDTHVNDSLEDLEEEAYSAEDCVEEAPFEVKQTSDEGFPVEEVCEASEPLEELIPQSIVRTCTPSPPSYQPDEVTVPPVSAPPAVSVVVPPVTEVSASTDNVLPPPVPLSSPPRDSPTPEEEDVLYEETRVELSARPQQNGDLGSSPFVESKETLEARDNKKKGKKKVRDLNRKGEGKEGSEMDAFVVDKEEEEMSTLVSSQNLPPSIATKVVLSSPDREEDEEEQRKVAEKNQENTRVSSGQTEDVLSTPVIEPPEVKPPVPKYSYKEDIPEVTSPLNETVASDLPHAESTEIDTEYQWSPLNPEGKKHYDRAFLLKMQSQPMSLKKPDGLPNLEVIKDTAIPFKLADHGNRPAQVPMQVVHNRGNQPDFMPSYARGGTPRPPQGGNVNRRQSQQGRDKPKKIINISTSFNEDVKLHSSQNAWKPAAKAPEVEATSSVEDDAKEEAKTKDLYKKVRGILNKLTPQKFLTLLEQVKDMPIDTEERLKGVIDLVFEKAVDEPNFSVPYANMCKHLAMKAVPSGQNNQNVNFRKLLLTKCQKEFESDSRDEIRRVERLQEISTADPDKRKQMTEELEEELRKSRRRSLGNIKFIGELYKLNMLVTPIMHDCLKKLLKAEDEDSLECLCRLLTTVGKELETDKKSDQSEKRAQNKAMMDSYFEGMKKVVDNRHTSSRVRFMIQDVIELRLNNWIPRRIENNPKTIDQIHLEAEREAHEQHLMVQQPLANANKRPDDRDRRKNRSMQGGFEEGGWNTVGGNKSRGSAFNYDPSKGTIKLVSKPLETDSIQLGPTTRSWNRGSSGGGTRQANQESDSKSNMPTNRFQALANQDSEPRRTVHQSSSSSREPSRGRGSQGGGGPPMTLRKTPSQSNQISTERESAKDFVKTFFQNPPPPSTNAVSESNRDTPEPKESQPTPVAVAPPSSLEVAAKGQAMLGDVHLIGHDMDIDEMTKKATPIIDEYLHNNDLKEAIQCIVELASPGSIHLLVSFSINYVLERSNRTRISLGQLLRELMAKTILSLDQTLMGLESVFETVVDLEIDIPKVWQYLAEILFPLVQDGCLTFGTLEKAAAPCIQLGFGGKMFSNLLLVMSEHLNPTKIQELWQKSGLQWSNILSPGEDVAKFINTNKLEFTMQGVRAAPPESFSIEEIKKGLDNLLKRNSTNEEIFDWIEAKLDRDSLVHPSFIRALVTAVTESAIEEGIPDKSWDTKKIKDRAVILTRFIDGKDQLELQALYALQALDYRLQHPKGMLVRIFDALYDEDVISEDAFGQWEKSEDPAENEGRGVALKSVTSFFTWLQEADEEDDEN